MTNGFFSYNKKYHCCVVFFIWYKIWKMKIKIYGTNSDTNTLLEKVNFAIDELGLNDFISSEITTDEALKNDLWVTQEPALIIEEESIDFKDMIFEGIVPEIEELKSMFVSIVWGWDSWWGWGCSSGSCGSCSSGC